MEGPVRKAPVEGAEAGNAVGIAAGCGQPLIASTLGTQRMIGVPDEMALGPRTPRHDAGGRSLEIGKARNIGEDVVLPRGVGDPVEELAGRGDVAAGEKAARNESDRQADGRGGKLGEGVDVDGEPGRVHAAQANHAGGGEHMGGEVRCRVIRP